MLPREPVPCWDAFLCELPRNRLVAEPLLAKDPNALGNGAGVIGPTELRRRRSRCRGPWLARCLQQPVIPLLHLLHETQQVRYPTSAAHKIVKAVSRGRVYAVTFAEPFPTLEEARQLWREDRKAFLPYDETTGRYLRRCV